MDWKTRESKLKMSLARILCTFPSTFITKKNTNSATDYYSLILLDQFISTVRVNLLKIPQLCKLLKIPTASLLLVHM